MEIIYRSQFGRQYHTIVESPSIFFSWALAHRWTAGKITSGCHLLVKGLNILEREVTPTAIHFALPATANICLGNTNNFTLM